MEILQLAYQTRAGELQEPQVQLAAPHAAESLSLFFFPGLIYVRLGPRHECRGSEHVKSSIASPQIRLIPEFDFDRLSAGRLCLSLQLANATFQLGYESFSTFTNRWTTCRLVSQPHNMGIRNRSIY